MWRILQVGTQKLPTRLCFGTSIMTMRVAISVLLVLALGATLTATAFADCLAIASTCQRSGEPCCPAHPAAPKSAECHEFCLSVSSGVVTGVTVERFTDTPVVPADALAVFSPDTALVAVPTNHASEPASLGSVQLFKRIHVFLI